MIITCKEDFESLPDDVKNELLNTYHDADLWDLEEMMEWYEDEEVPFVRYEKMKDGSVDIWASHTFVKPELYVDIPMALCDWYHCLWAQELWVKGEPSQEYLTLKNHYSWFQSLSMGQYMFYNGDLNSSDVEWLYRTYGVEKLEIFVQNFYEYIEESIKQWISNVETYLSRSYEDCFSEERVIENLICNEYEVDYEI